MVMLPRIAINLFLCCGHRWCLDTHIHDQRQLIATLYIQTARLSGADCAFEDGATSTTVCNTVNCSIATTTTRTTTTTSNPYPFADECPVSAGGSSTATIDCSAAVAGEICCVLPVQTVCDTVRADVQTSSCILPHTHCTLFFC